MAPCAGHRDSDCKSGAMPLVPLGVGAMTENLLTLWEEALAPEFIPKYPTYALACAKGGEQTFYISDEIKLGNGRARVIVSERAAEPGELLRDSILRYIPDWSDNFLYRIKILDKCRSDPDSQSVVWIYCKSSILYFANVFCWSFDPRRHPRKRTPFVSYEFQDDLLTWLLWMVRYGRSGVGEKSRDMGMSWVAVIVGVYLAIFYDDMEILYMSMRQEDVDDRGMKSLLGKVRFLLNNIPEWMRAGWVEKMQGIDTEMDIKFPETHSTINGILSRGTAGRSGRATVCFNDEFAFVEDSANVLSALSELADAKLYLSTPAGPFGAFYEMATAPGSLKRTLHWSTHPLKNPEWALRRRNELDMNEEIWAREHEINYESSVVGRVFPEFINHEGRDVLWSHVQEGDLVKYEPAYDVYDTSDLGISDPCSTLWFQIKPIPPEFSAILGTTECIVFFEEHQARNMTAFDLRYLFNEKDYRYRTHILDFRTATQRDSSGRTWLKNMEDPAITPLFSTYFRRIIDPGKPIRVSGQRSPERETIQNMRNVLNHDRYSVVFSRQGCPEAIRAILSWSFDLDRETRKPKRNDSPRHDQWSHYCKAILYAVDWLYGKSKKVEKPAEDWDFHVLPRAAGV